MPLQRLSLLMVLMCSRPKSGHSTLITYPCDTEVLVNQSTYFNCSTSILSEQIHWYHYRVGENRTNYVYYKGQFNQIYADRYSIEINTKTGEYNFIIRSVQPGDAGRYVCQDDGGLGKSSSAELIVLDATPTCLSNMKPDGVVGPNSCNMSQEKLQLSCSVSYIGNTHPILQWKIDGNDAPILEGVTTDYSGKRAKVNLTMSSAVEMDGDFLTCGATRSHDNLLSCSTDQAKINYAVGQPTILNIAKGENITCSVNASVPCTYRWFYNNDTQHTVSYNQVLTTNRLGNHSCEASCPIKGISCTFVAMSIIVFEQEPSEDNNETMPIAILIVAVIVVILLIIACVLYFLKRKERIVNRDKGVTLVLNPAVQIEGPSSSIVVGENSDVPKPNDKREKEPLLIPSAVIGDSNVNQKHIKEEEITTLMGRAIAGVASLDNVLYVVSPMCSEVEMFDIDTNGVTSYRSTVNLEELKDPWDLTSCKPNNCLYIMDCKSNTILKYVIRVDSSVKTLGQWSTEKVYGNLFVTNEGNVGLVVTMFDGSRLIIYSPDGVRLNVISLSEDMMIHPSHALKLINDQFLIWHVINEDDIHRVCAVEKIDEYYTISVTKLESTSDFIVNKTGFVFVADQGNSRVYVSNSDLKLKGEVAFEQNGSRGSERIFLHGNMSNGNLFVVDNDVRLESKPRDGKLLIFTYCKPNHNK